MEMLFLAAVTFVASAVNAVTGFGFGILAVALFSLVMPTIEAVSVTSMVTVLMSGVLVKLNVRHICWKQLLLPLPCALLMSYLCIAVGTNLSEHLLKRILGGALILLSIYFLAFSKRAKVRPTTMNGLLMGSASGALQGLIGAGGPPMVLYFLASTDSKEAYMATLQMYFIVMNLSVVGMRFLRGQITNACWNSFFIALLPMLLGIFWGNKLFKRTAEQKLRIASYGCMAICGLYFLVAG